jgi:1-deoxy-D-xylulose-5-phosphate synthase
VASRRSDIVAITAAMPDGTGLKRFRETYGNRFFDVGIAESHAVTFAAGLALKGMCPVVALYSTFLQRAYDQLLHDIALDNLKVIFCLDRAGLVGEDGPTHHGNFDLSYLRTVPNATILAPGNEKELRDMLFSAIEHGSGPIFIRYPRGRGTGAPVDQPFDRIEFSRPRIVRQGRKVAVISIGAATPVAQQACDLLAKHRLKPTLVDARFAKPLDEAFYGDLAKSHSHIVTIEHNTIVGGFGSGVLDIVNRQSPEVRVLTLGYPDRFVQHGSMANLLEELKLRPEDIAESITTFAKL